MKILMVHNHYRQYGGEDAVVKAEYDLLKAKGEDVVLYERHNEEIEKFWPLEKAAFSLNLDYSSQSYQEIKKVLEDFQPNICHVYNTFFMITPAVYFACRDAHVPVVQSLYNYRLMCANALFLRNGQRCEECLTQPRWKSILYGCYKNSSAQTALIVRMIDKTWSKGIWQNMVNRYITATEFNRQKHIEAGIPGDKIVVKPHFMTDHKNISTTKGAYALYVGRMSEEKGVKLLVDAWEKIDMPLKVIGAGPLLKEIKEQVSKRKFHHIHVLGYCPDEVYFKYLQEAKFVVVPSISHDNFPRTIVEAYSYGVPVLASRLDGIKEFIFDGSTGKLFATNNKMDLIEKAQFMVLSDSKVMGQLARKEYEAKYTPEANYHFLMKIYHSAQKSFQHIL